MELLTTDAYRLAHAGQIDHSGPAHASGEIEINADRETVWTLLAHVENWPQIRSDVTDVESIPGDGPGRFRWLAGGIPIESAFALVERPSRLNWANAAPGMEMACVYTFDDAGDNRTRVRCAESMRAPEAAPHIDSAVLASSIQSWLEGLKSLAEQTFAESGSR